MVNSFLFCAGEKQSIQVKCNSQLQINLIISFSIRVDKGSNAGKSIDVVSSISKNLTNKNLKKKTIAKFHHTDRRHYLRQFERFASR
jgi:hypothetical protein